MQLKQLLEADNDKIPLDNNKGDKSVAEKTDTRKTRLTLEQINRLRMLNDVKITEYTKELVDIKKQYAVPAAAE